MKISAGAAKQHSSEKAQNRVAEISVQKGHRTDLDTASWSGELELHDALFKQLAHRLPDELPQVRQRIAARLAG